MSSIQNLLRPHLRGMQAYPSARRSMSGGTLWLNANESPYPGPGGESTTANNNRYPNFQSTDLNRAYAAYAGIAANQLLSHRGSDEGIDLLIRAFCQPCEDAVLICPPTYGMYAIAAQLNNSPVVTAPLLQQGNDFQLDLAAIEDALNPSAPKQPRVKVIFLCNPSNPLGNLLEPKDIEQVLALAAGKAIVVVDEAYLEYAETSTQQTTAELSWASRIDTYANLVVLRTLSKAFGLAGIRVGFTLAQAELIQALEPVLAPYPLPEPSIQVATQALGLDALIPMRQQVIEAVTERQLLAQKLQALSWVKTVFPSTTNFILLQVPEAEAVMAYCQAAGVLLRQFKFPSLGPCIRISVGSPEENEQLMRILSGFGETQ
ncbi:histidinol-phosphate transaminase [Aliidiomarina taiwanensis]|uniref:Histidinol-phosphate aminotransferase n=1 Tax=Aliidiomarina taiwanensis TaxID=946228 RepID=A0A432X203_9GAMM|nr:histidinol-phosphate transaminase [Aliidiomarina taiwanensis]RUO40583.1 histidinol-phosphate transaminase [Aliidiomarina taiwanensis]